MALVFLAIDINVNPVMAEFGPFTLTWHGFFTAIAILVGVTLAIWLARRDGIPAEVGQEFALVAVPGAIIGARLFYVLEHWGDFWPDDMLDIVFGITDGGITLYGALIGGVATGVLYGLYQRWPVSIALDAAAPAIALGIAIGRLGGLLSGQHLASESGLPWAVRYTHPDTLGDLGVEVHPTVGGYEMLGSLALFTLLLFVLRRRVMVPGWVFCSFLGAYALMRFFLSYLLVEQQTVSGLAVTQIVSALAIGAAILAAGVLYRKPGPITDEWAERVWGESPAADEPPAPTRRGPAPA
jgi:phosphatidylglycerol---prolipoprotein diacylglyceryl transferase